MDFSNLQNMELDALKELAFKQGLTPHHRVKKETLIKQIIENATKPQVKQEMQHPAEKKSPEAKMNTEEEIRDACKQYFSKDGFEVTFHENTWRFRYKGAEDSGHMSVPLRVIRMKASTVAGGARLPRTVKNELGQDVMLA